MQFSGPVLEATIKGKLAAPHCEPHPARTCPMCGKKAVLFLNAETRSVQPDLTTHVCHPLLGGCNHGFTIY